MNLSIITPKHSQIWAEFLISKLSNFFNKDEQTTSLRPLHPGPMASRDTPVMGALGRLPPEISLIIWENLLDTSIQEENENGSDEDVFGEVIIEEDYREEQNPSDPREKFGFLRTCKQIYEEASYLLYNDVLLFEFFTTIQPWSGNGVSVTNSRGSC